jgi:predicted hydrolase (HD superfamily)
VKKTKTVNQALQAIDDINGFIQALRQASGEEDIKAICQSEITRIKQRESPTIAKRTISRYRSVVEARLGASHPAGPLLTWE